MKCNKNRLQYVKLKRCIQEWAKENLLKIVFKKIDMFCFNKTCQCIFFKGCLPQIWSILECFVLNNTSPQTNIFIGAILNFALE